MIQETNPLIREHALAMESYSTSASLDTVKAYIHFPENVRGKLILDVGGGASTATLELRKQGAASYAIDYRYSDFKDLKRSVDAHMSRLGSSSNIPSYEQLNEDMEKEIEKLSQRPQAGADPSLWTLTSRLTATFMRRIPPELLKKQVEKEVEGRKEYIKKLRKTRDYFFGSFDRGERPYIAAVSGKLPFREGSFDFVFSLLSVSHFLVSDRDVFMQSIQEMVRIVKPRGELQIHPWLGSPVIPWTEQQRVNFEEAQRYLSSQRINYKIERLTDPRPSPRLRLLKPYRPAIF